MSVEQSGLKLMLKASDDWVPSTYPSAVYSFAICLASYRVTVGIPLHSSEFQSFDGHSSWHLQISMVLYSGLYWISEASESPPLIGLISSSYSRYVPFPEHS